MLPASWCPSWRDLLATWRNRMQSNGAHMCCSQIHPSLGCRCTFWWCPPWSKRRWSRSRRCWGRCRSLRGCMRGRGEEPDHRQCGHGQLVCSSQQPLPAVGRVSANCTRTATCAACHVCGLRNAVLWNWAGCPERIRTRAHSHQLTCGAGTAGGAGANRPAATVGNARHVGSRRALGGAAAPVVHIAGRCRQARRCGGGCYPSPLEPEANACSLPPPASC